MCLFQAVAGQSPVIVVGTHADVCDERHLQDCVSKLRDELLSQTGFPVIRENHMLCACEESESISRLRKAIYKELIGFKVLIDSVTSCDDLSFIFFIMEIDSNFTFKAVMLR